MMRFIGWIAAMAIVLAVALTFDMSLGAKILLGFGGGAVGVLVGAAVER
jgi:hypothetical protein